MDLNFFGNQMQYYARKLNGQTGVVEAFRNTKFRDTCVRLDANGKYVWIEDKEAIKI